MRSLKAFLMGYIWFEVSGRYFYSYEKARAYKNEMAKNEELSMYFDGFNIFYMKKFRFYSRTVLVQQKWTADAEL